MKIGWYLKKAHWLFRNSVNRKLKTLDLTDSQFSVLGEVACASREGREINQRMIEGKLELSNPTVTGIINRLEAKELIQRKESLEDKRVKNLVLSFKGKELMDQIKDEFDYQDQKALKGFSEEEILLLQSLLTRVMENLK